MRLSSPFKDRLQQGTLNLSGYHIPWLSGNSQALLWCFPFPAVIVFQPIKLLCGFSLFCWDEIMRGDSFSCLVALNRAACVFQVRKLLTGQPPPVKSTQISPLC